MKRRILATIMTAGLVLGMLTGCGGKDDAAQTPADTSQPADNADAAETLDAEETPAESGSEEKVKVALLLSGSANDNSWNQFGYEALMKVEQETGAEVAFSENVATADQLQAIRDYAAKGYDVIIGHGGAYEDDMIKAGKDFPDTQFVIIAGGTGAEPNVLAVDTAPWQYGYSYGWVAANITKTNKIGFVTGMEGVSTMNNLVGSWRDGAKSVNPDLETIAVYIADMGDVAQAREAAMSLKAAGCDVIVPELNAGFQGVVDVCKENGIYTVGRTEADVEYAPEQLLTYTVFDWGPKYVDIVKKYMENGVSGGAFFYGFHTPDAPGFVFNYDESNGWNPAAVTEDIAGKFQTEVVDMFAADPIRSYTAEDAASGTK